MKPLNEEQQKALDIAICYATIEINAWHDTCTKDMKRLVQIVYDRPARHDECGIYSYRTVSTKIVLDAISRTGFFATPKDRWKVRFYALTVLSAVVTVGTWAALYFRK